MVLATPWRLSSPNIPVRRCCWRSWPWAAFRDRGLPLSSSTLSASAPNALPRPLVKSSSANAKIGCRWLAARLCGRLTNQWIEEVFFHFTPENIYLRDLPDSIVAVHVCLNVRGYFGSLIIDGLSASLPWERENCWHHMCGVYASFQWRIVVFMMVLSDSLPDFLWPLRNWWADLWCNNVVKLRW